MGSAFCVLFKKFLPIAGWHRYFSAFDFKNLLFYVYHLKL